jgi:ZF-HD class homeobox domain-containing protein
MELGEHDGDMGVMALPMLYGGPAPNIHESSKLKPGENGTAGTGTPSDETRPSDHELLQHEHHHHQQTVAPAKKSVRYRECLKNHAASIGGHAIDGCGDFMPSGEDGSLEALKCAACNCHRNFHRREVEGEPPCYYCYSPRSCGGRKRGAGPPMALLGPPAQQQHPINATPLALPPTSAHMVARSLLQGAGDNDQDGSSSMSYLNAYGTAGMMPIVMKKRFRTKFSNEQKEKMLAFAEKVGWRIQKHDDAAVHQFCMDVGVKRHVLKVWMHNNKSHMLATKAQRSEEQCTSQ